MSRTIIAGSRGCMHLFDVYQAVYLSGFQITVVISGGAKGADRLGEIWAEQNNVPIEVYPADWEKHNKSAGYIRNAEMAAIADQLILLWDGVSSGSRHMRNIARDKNIPTYVHLILI